MVDVIIIGGGAAGIFCSVLLAEQGMRVVVLEKSNKLLAKVRISGGGRCNVTHDTGDTDWMARCYPRGDRFMKRALKHFGPHDVMRWFEERGVALKTEPDNRVFPCSDSSSTIIDCLLEEARKGKVDIRMQQAVTHLHQEPDVWRVELANGPALKAPNVVVATGGHPQKNGYRWLTALGITIEDPVPSLFTFHIADPSLHALSGISLPVAKIKVGTGKNAYQGEGAVLITHWGLSGPAVLRASAFGARWMYDGVYHFPCTVNWIGLPEDDCRMKLNVWLGEGERRLSGNSAPFHLPKRFWSYLLQRSGIPEEKRRGEWGKKERNRMVTQLCGCQYQVTGKSTFKEEFVTSGGVSLNQLTPLGLEHKKLSGLHFAGEVMNVDGITGGFNFQHAWTSAWLIARSIGPVRRQL